MIDRRTSFSIFRIAILRIAPLVGVLLGSLALVSAPQPPFSPRDKAYYADEKLVNFVRPGLVVKITSADIAADGTVRARFKLTDPRGLGLDRVGVTSPGTVNLSFIAAYLPKDQTQYVSYATRVQTSPITGVAGTQAAGENTGRFDVVGDGEYTYTFLTKAPVTIDRTATHSIGVYGSRNLTEFDLGTQYDDDVFSFVPDGSKVTQVRDLIGTATCNKCHDPLALHGGSRRSVELCILCHTPQTTDPDTGNTVDFKVMIHKIHEGEGLPSVTAGKKYQIIGNQGNVHDYSTVVFPADTRNCQFCHEAGRAQSNNFLKPSRAACGSCHDNVNFATGENHADLPQVSDNQCSTCHIPQGELDFDVSIFGAHTIPRFSKSLPGTVFELIRVDNGAKGQKPTVTFGIKDKSGKPISPKEMTRLALVLSGPSTDYAAYVSEDALQSDGKDGVYFWTFTNALPATASGTYSIGIEGYRNVKLLEGTKKEVTVRDAGVNKVIHFAVDGSRPAPRRTVVALAKCNSCHSSLSLHGDNRNQIEQCVLCHNPNETDRTRRPAAENPAQSVDFRSMIHRIHTGEAAGTEYVIYGFGGSKNDFGEVRFPGDRRNCQACHVGASEQVPLNENLLSVVNPRGYLNPTGPTAAACLGCHTTKAVASHALANTTTLGESCAACHSANSEFGVSRVHAR